MTKEEIDARFAALDAKMAQVDEQLAALRGLLDRKDAAIRLAVEKLSEIAPAPALSWKWDGDARWMAPLPGGGAGIVERLDDGVSFLPRVVSAEGDRADGPVSDGLMSAAKWCAERAA